MRISRASGEKILPTELRISGAAEEVEADLKSSSTAACRKKRFLLPTSCPNITEQLRRGEGERREAMSLGVNERGGGGGYL